MKKFIPDPSSGVVNKKTYVINDKGDLLQDIYQMYWFFGVMEMINFFIISCNYATYHPTFEWRRRRIFQ